MATATKTPRSLNDAAEQVVELNERFVDAGKRAGNLYLDSYDKFVEGVTSFQEKFAEQSKNDTVKSVVATQVEMTRQLASAYTSAARELIA
jgi:transcription initiation factor TFIID subunit TAF12